MYVCMAMASSKSSWLSITLWLAGRFGASSSAEAAEAAEAGEERSGERPDLAAGKIPGRYELVLTIKITKNLAGHNLTDATEIWIVRIIRIRQMTYDQVIRMGGSLQYRRQ